MIIISGASNGIGKFLLENFIKNEEEVIGFYNTSLPMQNRSNYYQLNVVIEEEIEKFILLNIEKLKKLVLINCAGVNYNNFVHKFDYGLWKSLFDVNVHGVFLMIKHFLPIMREQMYGRIINFSSVVPQIGTVGTAAYASSKSALWGLTKVVANENATKGITANCLNLGYFDIGMINGIPEKFLKDIIENIPSKKLGNPLNIFSAINFLIKSDYTTGASIDINGGLF